MAAEVQQTTTCKWHLLALSRSPASQRTSMAPSSTSSTPNSSQTEQKKKKLSLWDLGHLGLIAVVLLIAAARFLFLDAEDRYHCEALLNEGRWLDVQHEIWQPDGCMLHPYTAKDLSTCFVQSESNRVLFIGDSIARQSFLALARIADPYLTPSYEKHADQTIRGPDGLLLEYRWDPFLNSSSTASLLQPSSLDEAHDRPALLVFSTGLWHLRYLSTESAQSTWASTVDRIFASASAQAVADQVILLPLTPVVEPLLTAERAATLSNTAISEFNALLKQKEAHHGLPSAVEVPWAWNVMLGQDATDAADQTLDGLHYSDLITGQQAQVLVNLRCNDFLPKKFPLDKTCCGSFPTPNLVQILLLLSSVFLPLAGIHMHRQNTSPLLRYIPSRPVLAQISIFGAALTLIFLADRTPLFMRSTKAFHENQFVFLSVLALLAGVASMQRSEKGDLGFMNRPQTDEWKGWMQVAILIYHYTGASKISPIYNPIRSMVAAYLFMSGYGHFFFYYKKGDYSFARIFAVLCRLNLLPVVLAYTMDTDWLSYYFSPLVSMWFCIIWLTMWLFHSQNHIGIFVLVKIFLSALLVGLFFFFQVPLRLLFELTNSVFLTEWNAREWTFRVTLDFLVAYVGMVVALIAIKLSELRLAESHHWSNYAQMGVYVAVAGSVGYVFFENSLDKFTYNIYHPYASIVPVVAFAILRNATPFLRSVNSRFFMYFGQCSLETFIIQFHLWLAADTKGLLVFVRGTSETARIINFVISSLIFVYVSEKVARASGTITTWLSAVNSSQPQARTQSGPSSSGSATYASLPTTNPDSPAEKFEIESPEDGLPPSRSARLFNYLASSLKLRMVAILVVLWLLNLVYPTESAPEGHLLPTH